MEENKEPLYLRASRKIMTGDGDWRDVVKFLGNSVRVAIDPTYSSNRGWRDVGAPHLQNNLENIAVQTVKAAFAAKIICHYL